MSKSVGNVLPLRDVLDRLPTAALRLLVCQAHYRSPFEWSDDAERQAKETLETLKRNLDVDGLAGSGETGADLEGAASASPDEVERAAGGRLEEFDRQMDDDLGTPRALAALFTLSNEIAACGRTHRDQAGIARMKRVRDEVLKRLGALGIVLDFSTGELPADLSVLLREREEARKRKDWGKADEIRKAFKDRGWEIEDTSRGSVTRKL